MAFDKSLSAILMIGLLYLSRRVTAAAVPFPQITPVPTNSILNDLSFIGARADEWARCLPEPEERCSLFIATGDSAPMEGTYRNVVLYDHQCVPLDIAMTTVENSKVVLRGSLEYYVDVYMDSEASPWGYIHFKGATWFLHEGQGFGASNMECHAFEGLDGRACRITFSCA